MMRKAQLISENERLKRKARLTNQPPLSGFETFSESTAILF